MSWVALAAGLLSEHPGAAYWIGAEFIAAGVIAATRRPAARKAVEAPEPRRGEVVT